MPADADLLVIGGGCAGLSLAAQLGSYKDRAPRTVVLEQRSTYQNDRTWCFWGDDTTPYAHLADHQWGELQLINGEQQVLIDCNHTTYRMLKSSTFYDSVLTGLAHNPLFSIQLNAAVVTEPIFRDGLWHVETSQGALAATMVVDTRPAVSSSELEAVLWQSFYGHEVLTNEPCFDPACAELMDFSAPNPMQIGFTYTLPVSTTRALIEFTTFSAERLTAADLEKALMQSIAKKVGGKPYKIVHSEYGLLPMGITQRGANSTPKDPSYIVSGLHASAGRPSTGYAFQRIQNWAAQCAASIVAGGPAKAQTKDPYFLSQMDRIFLNVLRDNPRHGPALFTRLFSKAKSEQVIRFLSDKAHLSDYVAIIRAMPTAPFIKQLFSGKPLL
jgi:lycopene beta-cyclase